MLIYLTIFIAAFLSGVAGGIRVGMLIRDWQRAQIEIRLFRREGKYPFVEKKGVKNGR